MISTEHIEKLRQRFDTHQATLIQDTERFLIIDWRRSDGSGDYYVNYIVDKKRGGLIVSGDLGDCIAMWYNPITPDKLKRYIYNDIGYYLSKFQASSDTYYYDDEDVINEIKEKIGESVNDYYEDADELENFWSAVEDEVYGCYTTDEFAPSQSLIELIEKFDEEYYEWLHTCGQKIHPRCYLWATGFYMACEQLGI